jgi:hypothetical protein
MATTMIADDYYDANDTNSHDYIDVGNYDDGAVVAEDNDEKSEPKETKKNIGTGEYKSAG